MNQIKKIKVEKLFGIFNHEISLGNSDGITILHGPNGFGKTTLLRMIASFCEGDPNIFTQVSFETFTVELAEGKTVTITQEKENDGPKHIQITHSGTTNDPLTSLTTPKTEIPPHILDLIDTFVPSPYSRHGNGWINQETRKRATLQEIIKRFPSVISKVPQEYRPQSFIHPIENTPAFFVETKRLDADKSTPMSAPRQQLGFFEDANNDEPSKSRVEQYSVDIINRINAVITDYAKYSQERDRTFPERLVQFIREGSAERNAKEIVEDMAKLESDRKRLMSLGFLDSETGLRDLQESELDKVLPALTIYVDDISKKLAIFSELSLRVGTLIDILNSRYRYKEISLSKDQGFIFKSPSGKRIPIASLSSGEQHELIMHYELLFRTPQNGIVLVDEPEISLHVGWQNRFLSDLKRILKLNNCYGIIATHSPTIIGARWDLTQELTGPKDGKEE